MKEKDMWPLIARCLKKKFKWGPDWWAQCGKHLGHWPAGMGAGQPDVVGVANFDTDPEVHIVEGKLLRSRENFDQTMAQLRNWRPYGNRLWVAFNLTGWTNWNKQQRDSCKRQIEAEGFGLVLVNPKRCRDRDRSEDE